MKKTIINSEIDNVINWNKPQWLILDEDIIILTTGKHTEDYFEGTILPCKLHPEGGINKYILKKGNFKYPIKPLTITIEN